MRLVTDAETTDATVAVIIDQNGTEREE